MKVQQLQVAANRHTKPISKGRESACRMLLTTSTIAIYFSYSTDL